MPRARAQLVLPEIPGFTMREEGGRLSFPHSCDSSYNDRSNANGLPPSGVASALDGQLMRREVEWTNNWEPR